MYCRCLPVLFAFLICLQTSCNAPSQSDAKKGEGDKATDAKSEGKKDDSEKKGDKSGLVPQTDKDSDATKKKKEEGKLEGPVLGDPAAAVSSDKESDNVKEESWGTADGKEVFLYTLTNENGVVVKVTNWGATITELYVKDRDGKLGDVVLGYESLDRWLDSDGDGNANPSYFGCTVGRYCNRIAGGKFELDGETHDLAQNNDPNHLHGGNKGWDKMVWSSEVVQRDEGAAVKFKYTSPNGDENYPGEVTAEVVYILTDDDALHVEMAATTDKATPISLTNHSYFNLAGEGNGTILDHELKLEAERYTVFGEGDIPTGEISSVEDTPFDFRTATKIGERIDQFEGDPGGYDQNYVLSDEKSAEPKLAATVYDPQSGRVMEIHTTEVGIQFYTGNYLDGSLVGKSGKKYEKRFGLCLEPQFHPDSPNKPEFPSCILKPGERYAQTSIYKFGVRE